jgi:hypothetical protein
MAPVVSVLAPDQIEISWNAHPAPDVAGYNLYRGLAIVHTVKEGTPAAWKDNDPLYPEPLPVEVRDITDLHRLNAALLNQTSFTDRVDLAKAASGDYKYAVYA